MSKPPDGWAQDELSEFIRAAYNNTWASFHKLKSEYSRAAKIDEIFHKSALSMHHPTNLINWFLMTRSHSAFRTACQLALGGQIVESSLCQRSVLEFALYALHIDGHPNLSEIWVRRNDSPKSRKECKNAFQISPILKAAKLRLPPQIHKALETLYDRTIDNGAHPNVDAVLVSSQFNRDENRNIDQLIGVYLHGDGKLIQIALRNAARVGGVAIHIFREIFTRLQLMDIDGELQKTIQGL